jgi:hypothetical protein
MTPSVLGGVFFSGGAEIKLFVPLVAAGARLGIGPAGRVGILFLQADDIVDLDRLAQQALRRQLYKIL